MRGTVSIFKGTGCDHGITPACAGNSYSSHQRTPQAQDHPRVCGEQALVASMCVEFAGSPPRVRGTGKPRRVQDVLLRITPACAGNRQNGVDASRFVEDHPRVCGEQTRLARQRAICGGSPPRVRGTVHAPFLAKSCSRITPACAGNSTAEHANKQTGKDHPRVCGEQQVIVP